MDVLAFTGQLRVLADNLRTCALAHGRLVEWPEVFVEGHDCIRIGAVVEKEGTLCSLFQTIEVEDRGLVAGDVEIRPVEREG